MPVPPEPTIIIQGEQLTEAQAMTLRVALGHFQVSLADDDFCNALGEIGPHYQQHARDITLVMQRDAETTATLARVDASLARRLSECWAENNRLRKRVAELGAANGEAAQGCAADPRALGRSRL